MRSITILVIACCLVSAADESRKSGPSKPDGRVQKTAALTGCMDQREETYILADEQMHREMKLRGQGFSDDNFARYVGHRVRLLGEMDQSGGSDVFSVTKIEDVSQTCVTK